MIMLLFIILFFIEFSSIEQCLLSNYCTCSTDLTIVKCTDRQLTNEFLLKLNNQLSNSTIVLNLSSNSLTSIKSLSNLHSLQILDLSLNKIRSIPSNFFSKYPQLISLYIQKNPLKIFPKLFRNLSTINLNLSKNLPQNHHHLQQSQIVYENEQFLLNCSSNSPHYWTLNGQFYPSTIITSFYSIILLHHLQINQSGIWTCQNSDSIHHSISLTVLANSSNYFCQSIQMNTSKGYFYWPRTLINQRIETKCPYGSAAWLGNSNDYARAWYTCSSNGQWMNFDISQCGYQTNISRIFDNLSLDENNLLLLLVKYLAGINRNHMKLNDIILLIDLIDEQQEKYQNQDRIMLIYHLTDFILQIKSNFYFNNQYQLAMNRLRLIIQRLLDLTNQSWLYIGKELTAMTLQSPSSSILCFVSNRSLLTINCDVNHQQYKSQLVTIAFPSDLNITNQYSLFRIIVYRQSILFSSNENNPVVYIRPVSRNSFSTIRITFSDPSDEASIGVWHTNQTVWQRKSSICKINQQNENFLSTNCILSNNNSLSVTYFNNKNLPTSIFLNQKYSQFIICVSSIIASICFIISILFHLFFHKISPIPRRHYHCLINYWINLLILFPLFAFGIEQNQYPFLCHFIGITLHYLCLTTTLWLTLITYSIWRKLYVISIDKDDERKSSLIIVDYQPERKSKSKPVIQFYLLAYGIALFICGINVGVSHEPNLINKICFLNHFNSMLILIIPMLIFIFLLLIFLLFARNYINNKSGIPTKEILILSNRNFHHSYLSNINHQYKSINQLLSILFQLILLIFLFLSTLAIYLRPLRSFKLRFEHIIYSHLYGFFLLFLAFYIFSFHVLSRSRLIIRYYFHRTNNDDDDYLSNQSLSIDNKQLDSPSSIEQIPQSFSQDSSSNRHVCDVSQNTIITDDHEGSSKRLINITSKYYICHEHILKTNSSQHIPNEKLPVSSSETISHETNGIQKSQQSSKRSINIPIEYHTMPTKNIPLHSTPIISSQSFTHSPISPSQAIIRSLPIIRLSLQNKTKSLSNSIDNQNSSRVMSSSSSTEEYNIINQNNHSFQAKSTNEHARVLYIDEDDEPSVSLISSISNSQTSSYTITKRTRSQTLSTSSSDCSNDLYSYRLKIHESSV